MNRVDVRPGDVVTFYTVYKNTFMPSAVETLTEEARSFAIRLDAKLHMKELKKKLEKDGWEKTDEGRFYKEEKTIWYNVKKRVYELH